MQILEAERSLGVLPGGIEMFLGPAGAGQFLLSQEALTGTVGSPTCAGVRQICEDLSGLVPAFPVILELATETVAA